MEKLRFANGIKPESLTKDQKEKLSLLIQAGGDGLLGIECFNNLNTSIEEEIPIGTAFYFSPNAVADSTLISNSLYQMLSVARIIEAPYEIDLTDKHFQKNATKIESAVPNTVSIENSIKNGIETGPWLSELGGTNSFVGVYYQMRDDHKGKDYFVVGRGTAPTMVQYLKSEIDKSAPTYGQFVNDAEWQKKLANVQYMSTRNLNRNLAQTAEAYNVGINRMPDFSAVTKNPDHGVGERAEPEFQQNLFSVQNTKFEGKPAIVFYNGVVPKDNITKEKFFMVSDPAKDGIYVFPVSEQVKAPAISGNTTQSLGRTVKEEMKQGGWNPEHHIGIMVPLVAKVYNEDGGKQ